MDETPAIEVRRLTRELPSGDRLLTILDDVTFSVSAEQMVAILGPSGSGKSTLLALIAGLDRPTRGEIFVGGEPVHALGEDALARLRRERIGFVFQSFQLLGNQTARENVLLPLELVRVPDPGRRADELLALVDLADRGHHYPVQLSGGEQQRVALARAFAARPAVLLADEPTGNLDSRNGARILDLLEALRRDAGTTLVVVTHDPAVAGRADRQLHLRDGRVVRDTAREPAPAAVPMAAGAGAP